MKAKVHLYEDIKHWGSKGQMEKEQVPIVSGEGKMWIESLSQRSTNETSIWIAVLIPNQANRSKHMHWHIQM